MPELSYTIVITETERAALAKALGGLVAKLISAPVFVEAESSDPLVQETLRKVREGKAVRAK